MKTLLLCAALAIAKASPAQTPPANQPKPTGICKDGTFTISAVKDGACHGHKGLKSWYGASISSQPVPTPGTSPSLPVPSVTSAASSTLPAPTVTQSSSAAALPVPTTASSIPSRPAATLGTASPAALPAPTPMTSTPAEPVPGIATERAHLAAMPAAPGGGPGMVWVNNSSKVYHCFGSDFYGRTKSGTYMTEADAKASGAHPNRNKPCS